MIKLHAYVGEGAPVPPTQHIWARLPEVSFGGFTQTPSRRPSFPPSLFFYPLLTLFPCACNWKCIYCRPGGWTAERERGRERDTLQLMKIWLWLGPQGLAPLLLHQLTASVNFFLSFLFFNCSLCLRLLRPFNSSVFGQLLLQRLAFRFFLPSCLFHPLSVFIILDWTCIRSILNANDAAEIDSRYVLALAISWRGKFRPSFSFVHHWIQGFTLNEMQYFHVSIKTFFHIIV